jgi:hypothetical protein
VYRLTIHPDAVSDIAAIRASDPSTAADILVFLQELQSDQDLMDRLSQDGYRYESGHWVENIDVQSISEQRRAGRNLWRLKLCDLEREHIQYRIIYAFSPLSHAYHVLAIVNRGQFNYESEHPITRRVVDALGAL